MSKSFSRFLSWLGGADEEALGKVPSERAKFNQMAGVLIATAALAAVSMTFAMHDGLDVPLPAAILAGVAWSLIIITLDRMLMLGIGLKRGFWSLTILAAPRFLIALLISVVVSTPLVLRVFASDIDRQIHINQLVESSNQKDREKKTFEFERRTDLEKKIGDARKILAGELPDDFTTPEVDAAKARVDDLEVEQNEKRAARDKALEAWQCELYGEGPKCRNASRKKGNGPLAGAKKMQYGDASRAYERTNTELTSARNALKEAQRAATADKGKALGEAQGEARKNIDSWQKELAAINLRLRDRADEGERINEANDDIATQVQVLFQISENNSALGAMHLLLFLLFLMIETLPVTVKILMNLGPVSAYENYIKLREERLVRLSEAAHNTEQAIAEDRERVRTTVERNMRDHEETLGKMANEHVAKEMELILGKALADWSARLRGRLNTAEGAAQANGASRPQIQLTPIAGLPDENDL